MNSKLLVTCALTTFSVLALAADPGMAGRWSVDFDVAGNARHSDLVLEQDGERLSGTIHVSGSELPVAGEAAGRHATWRYDTLWNGQVLTLVFTGDLDDAGKWVGTVEVRPMNVEGTFTATRAD
jgi:hypothetical protein